MRSGFRPLVNGLIMTSAAGQFALVPVMPAYARRLGLSGFQQGAVLAAIGIAALAVCLPSGRLCDRFGARRMTLLAGLLMAAGSLGQTWSGDFATLFAARLAFGAGYGIVWTAGLAWLAAAAPGGARGIGGTVACGGIGGVLGPAVSGMVVQRFRLGMPPLATAIVCGVITCGLIGVRVPSATGRPRTGRMTSPRAFAMNRGLAWAGAAVITAGLSSSVCNLLVPAALHADGMSATGTGLHFAVAGVAFAIGGALTAAGGRRAQRLPVLLAAMLVQIAAISLAVVSTAAFALIAMLYVTSTARSVLWTVSYTIAAASAEESDLGVGASVGLLNGGVGRDQCGGPGRRCRRRGRPRLAGGFRTDRGRLAGAHRRRMLAGRAGGSPHQPGRRDPHRHG
jgi:MFS family permease